MASATDLVGSPAPCAGTAEADSPADPGAEVALPSELEGEGGAKGEVRAEAALKGETASKTNDDARPNATRPSNASKTAAPKGSPSKHKRVTSVSIIPGKRLLV